MGTPSALGMCGAHRRVSWDLSIEKESEHKLVDFEKAEYTRFRSRNESSTGPDSKEAQQSSAEDERNEKEQSPTPHKEHRRFSFDFLFPKKMHKMAKKGRSHSIAVHAEGKVVPKTKPKRRFSEDLVDYPYLYLM